MKTKPNGKDTRNRPQIKAMKKGEVSSADASVSPRNMLIKPKLTIKLLQIYANICLAGEG